MPYFDLKSGDHLMYPRFVPHNGSNTQRTKFRYSIQDQRSIPGSLVLQHVNHSCSALPGNGQISMCPESNHSDPVVPCPEEPVRIDRR